MYPRRVRQRLINRSQEQPVWREGGGRKGAGQFREMRSQSTGSEPVSETERASLHSRLTRMPAAAGGKRIATRTRMTSERGRGRRGVRGREGRRTAISSARSAFGDGEQGRRAYCRTSGPWLWDAESGRGTASWRGAARGGGGEERRAVAALQLQFSKLRDAVRQSQDTYRIQWALGLALQRCEGDDAATFSSQLDLQNRGKPGSQPALHLLPTSGLNRPNARPAHSA